MRLIAILGLSLLFGSASFAGPCLPGTLADYINLGSAGCSQGVVQFSNFGIAPGQAFATPIPASTVLVTPGGSGFNPFLTFTVNRTAQALTLLESFFRFQATGPQLVAAGVSLNGSATGDGAAIAALDVCGGALFPGNSPLGCGGPSGTAIAAIVGGLPGSPSDTVSLPFSSFFDVFTDLTVDGGLAGSATLTSATVSVTATPEPSTLLLVITGVAAAILRRRK